METAPTLFTGIETFSLGLKRASRVTCGILSGIAVCGRVLLFWYIGSDLWDMSLCREPHHWHGQGKRSVQDRGDCSKIAAIASQQDGAESTLNEGQRYAVFAAPISLAI